VQLLGDRDEVSAEASYVTGIAMSVDGGRRA
jgi:hypothetical protein